MRPMEVSKITIGPLGCTSAAAVGVGPSGSSSAGFAGGGVAGGVDCWAYAGTTEAAKTRDRTWERIWKWPGTRVERVRIAAFILIVRVNQHGGAGLVPR